MKSLLLGGILIGFVLSIVSCKSEGKRNAKSLASPDCRIGFVTYTLGKGNTLEVNSESMLQFRILDVSSEDQKAQIEVTDKISQQSMSDWIKVGDCVLFTPWFGGDAVTLTGLTNGQAKLRIVTGD